MSDYLKSDLLLSRMFHAKYRTKQFPLAVYGDYKSAKKEMKNNPYTLLQRAM